MTTTMDTTHTVLRLFVAFGLLGYVCEAALQQSHQQQNVYQPFSQNVIDEERKTKNVAYDHLNDLQVHVVDRFDHRYPDGSYEYRFELSDGTARYERGYFLKYDKQKELVVVGYYSYRMPNGQFLTVFYNADRYGYRQNQAITRDTHPELPRSINVPQGNDGAPIDATTLRPSLITPTTTTNRLK